ncbi:hypothetical protein GQ457_11G028890 [Hibiscus cannabinus]
MDCNKDEAIRAKGLAEKKLAEMDAVGAKRFALKAQSLYPELDGLPQLLATLDVYISADKKINGEVDWYRVLVVQPFADEDTIRKHYRKLALVLHPDKNKSVGANEAFKILSEAWSLLSDKAKRIAYDHKQNLRGSYTNVFHGKSSSSATTSRNGFHNFSGENISNTNGRKCATYSKPAPRTVRNDTFWTTCNSCKMLFEYSRVYVNLNLPCINCRTPFIAVETPTPAINASSKYTSFSEFMQQQKFCQVHNAGQARFSGSSTKISRKGVFPRSTTGETLKSGYNKSETDIMRDENLEMKFHPSQKTDAGLVTGSSASVSSFAAKKQRPKKRRIDETEMGNEGVIVSSFQKSDFENTAGISRTNSDEGNGKDAVSMKSGAHESMKYVDSKSSIQPKRSYTVDSHVDPARKEPDSMSMNVPDPDFHDFDLDRTEKSFGENQVWAAYDDDEGMPRYYAMIHGVISLKPFKMRMSWVNSKGNVELAPLNWINSGFYKTSGDFWVGKYEVNRSLNSLSHKVKWSKGRKGAIQIYPRKGDVWVVYRNWSTDWNELTPDEVIHRYDIVEVLEDYDEHKGVAVAPLVKVPGFKTVFWKHSEQSKTRMIPREELFRFSHQVPSYVLTGQAGLNAPKGCLELDPAATPLDLLQVLTEAQVKEMEMITETVQEMKPKISVESAGQAVIEEEIKEENENKKPRMLVYGRRQQRKRET